MRESIIIEATPSPPPPPPPPPEPTKHIVAPGRSSRKLLYVVVATVIIVVAVIAGVLLLGGWGNNSGQLASASSLKFSASMTGGTTNFVYTFYAKNIGTDNLMVRVDGTFAGIEGTYIINGAQHKVWVNSMGIWQDLSSDWYTFWSTWQGTLDQFRGYLNGWTGGDYSTSLEGGNIRIYNIQVNPQLADSLFVH